MAPGGKKTETKCSALDRRALVYTYRVGGHPAQLNGSLDLVFFRLLHLSLQFVVLALFHSALQLHFIGDSIGFRNSFCHLQLISQSRLKSRKPQTKSCRWYQGINDCVVMISIMVGKSNRSVVGLILCMENIQRVLASLGSEDFDWTIEQLTDRLDFGVIAVDTIQSLSCNVLLKRLSCYELREVFLVSLLYNERIR
jgi:hypothetical protein